jgi:hypothetical protein
MDHYKIRLWVSQTLINIKPGINKFIFVSQGAPKDTETLASQF